MKRGYWTKEKCQEVALLCKYRNEFNKKYKVAYVTSSKNGWLSEICSHMMIMLLLLISEQKKNVKKLHQNLFVDLIFRKKNITHIEEHMKMVG